MYQLNMQHNAGLLRFWHVASKHSIGWTAIVCSVPCHWSQACEIWKQAIDVCHIHVVRICGADVCATVCVWCMQSLLAQSCSLSACAILLPAQTFTQPALQKPVLISSSCQSKAAAGQKQPQTRKPLQNRSRKIIHQ